MARRRKQQGRAVNGIVVLDKPKGISSNAALQQVKRLFNANKAGHTGSLDPLATGVLPLCLGEATKVSQFLLDSDKRYRTRIKLGVRTASADSEGAIIERTTDFNVTAEDVVRELASFRGEIQQLPPMYSALKQNGVPLYKLAREGKTVDRELRTVNIHSAELLDFDSDELTLEIFCSKGTYVRTIADDLGQALGCGGHIVELRRLQAGAFTDSDSITIEELEQKKDEGGFTAIDQVVFKMDRAVADLPEVVLPEITASCILQGQPVLVRHLPADGLVRLYDEEKFLGIGSILEDGRVAPKRLIVS